MTGYYYIHWMQAGVGTVFTWMNRMDGMDRIFVCYV